MLLHHIPRTVRWALLAFAFISPLVAAEATRRFDIAAGDAAQTLARFAEQANRGIVFSAAAVRGIKTNAVTGEHTPARALTLLVAATGPATTQDAKTGAISVRVEPPAPNGPRAAPPTASDRPSQNRNKSAVIDPPRSTDELLQLSPFEVVADPNDRYEALNFTSLSGTNKSLAKIPITAEVINETAIADLGLTNPMDVLRDFGTGIGNPYATAGGVGQQGGTAGDTYIQGAFKLRGLTAGVPRRNGFITSPASILDGLSLGRVEIIRGPQSLIYGTGEAGGVINLYTKHAVFGKNHTKVEARVDDQSSLRTTIDSNLSGQMFGRRLAIRMVAAKDDQNFWRDEIGIANRGFYAEGAVEIFRKTATTLRVEWEQVDSEWVQPRLISFQGNNDPVPNGTPLRVLLANHDPRLSRIFNGRITWDNVDSLGTHTFGTFQAHHYFGLTLNSKLAPWLQAQVMAAKSTLYNTAVAVGSFNDLHPPLTAGNPLNAWAAAYSPTGNYAASNSSGVRATFTGDFNVTRHAKNNLVVGGEIKTSWNWNLVPQFFEVDASGNFIVNPALANNATGGRNVMPLEWVSLEGNLAGYIGQKTKVYTHSSGRTYRWDLAKHANPAFAGPGNPYGYNGGSAGVRDTHTRNPGVFAALFTTWLNGKIDTLAGMRFDGSTNADWATDTTTSFSRAQTRNLGVVWHALPWLSPYLSTSSSTKAPGAGTELSGKQLPLGKGEGVEYGVKFSAYGGKLSGAATAFTAKATNESPLLDNATLNIADPVSALNGRFTTQGVRFLLDARSKGYEVTLTAQPTANWRVQFGYSHATGTQGNDVFLPMLYNDSFRTNASGQVLLADGTPLLVPVNPNTPKATDGKTYAAGVATEIMTVGILRSGDANGNYKAQLDPENGRILNASAVGLAVPGVGTGQVGLPLSQHQLGFVPPGGGTILARKGGDVLIGSPTDSCNVLSMYRINSGRLRGVNLGFNVQARYHETAYYYTDLADGGKRKLLEFPAKTTVNLILGYQRRAWREVMWRVQLNANNIFDRQHVRYFPDLTTGQIRNAILDAPPRGLVWTSSFEF